VERKDYREATHRAMERVETTQVALVMALPRLQTETSGRRVSIENLTARTLRKKKPTS
jgi:hypothetical protein